MSRTPLQQSTTYTLEGTFATERFAVTLGYDHIDTSQVGGSTTSTGKFTGAVGVRLPNIGPFSGTTVGPQVQVGDKDKNLTFGLTTHFGKVEKTPRVHCFKCDCPPPLPEYTCTRVVTEHTKMVQKEPAKDNVVKLLYNYNSAAPAEPKQFSGNIGSIASLAGEGFKVEHIWGYASPEGSLDKPKKPVAGFKGNIDLSTRRAAQARGAIAEKAPNVSLPEAEGKGEQLGDIDGTGDTADKDIIDKLVKLLEPRSPDERLDVLGVDEAVRNDPASKAQALADIEAFIQGRDQNGLRLATRPRWEKVFPFLRRVEVALHRDPVMEPVKVEGGSEKGCKEDDIAYARANMPALPPQRRLPPERCGR